jgi:glycosyltransferase involved in cell wall biosynthesis
MKKIVFITLYPEGIVPGPRFRYEQYLPFLKNENISYLHLPFFSKKSYENFQRSTSLSLLFIDILKGYFSRWIHLFACMKADYIFIFRDATPFGPPVFEWIIAKILRKKIIYDFDDSIWHTDLDKSQWLKIWLRNPSKTNKIIKWSWKISCGNEYLCRHSRKYNTNVVLNPTTIDTEYLHNKIKDQQTKRIVIGWTGTHSTLKYLEPLVPVIKNLEEKFDFDFLVICNKKPGWQLKSLVFLPWNKDSEIEDLMRINFGLMPLPDDEWSKGKCGFKALQYMALGMPALVSPVGVNTEIVSQGEEGYICEDGKDWEKYITVLLTDEQARIQMGKKARQKIIDRYSVLSNRKNFISLFR